MTTAVGHNEGVEFIARWSEPFTWQEVCGCEDAKHPGLYLWTVSTPLGRVAHYLGETGVSLAKRHLAHEAAYRSGEYGLRDWDEFRQGIDGHHKPSHYRKYTTERRLEFMGSREAWMPVIEQELLEQSIWLLPLSEWLGPDNRPLRMRLEKALGTEIIRLWPAGIPNLFEGYEEYRARPQSDPHRMKFEGPSPVAGLPGTLQF